MESPSEQLAKQIIDRLSQEKLLTPERAKRCLPKLAAGTLKTEDWKVEIELSQEAKEETEND
ncbi:MAG: hypothetical protein ACKO5P_07275 [Nodosilinea sp.]|jgi:hypothetical protein